MRTRTLILTEPLPVRETAAVRIATLHADVDEAVAKLSKKLGDHATSLHVSGWVDAPNGIEFSVIGRTIVGTLLLTRPEDN